MAKAKKAAPVQQPEKTILDHFAEHGLGGAPEVKANGSKQPKAAPDNDTLLKRIEELEGRASALDRENIALMTNVQKEQAATPQWTAPKVNLKDLPDPVQDPEGYNTALQEKITSAIAEGVQPWGEVEGQRQSVSSSQNAQVDQLWNDFAEKYEDIAEHQDAVEYAAAKVVKRAQDKGLDVKRYMFSARDRFLKDVADEARKYIPQGGDEAEEEVEVDASEDEGRTGGIFGGQESGGKPTEGGEKPKLTMMDDMRALQKRDGIY